MQNDGDVSLPVIKTESAPANFSQGGCNARGPIFGFPATALWGASLRPEVTAAMRAFYEETDRLIADHHPTCWNKGLCCDFTRLGSRLYVTALEVCYYLAGHRAPAVAGDVCPHAYDGSCHARDHRPLGCRVYHCDPQAQAWQGPLMEERLVRLRALHAESGVAYFYADWIRILRSLGPRGSMACA